MITVVLQNVPNARFRRKLEEAVWGFLTENADPVYRKSILDAAPYTLTGKRGDTVLRDICDGDETLTIRCFKAPRRKRMWQLIRGYKVRAYYDPNIPDTIHLDYSLTARSTKRLRGTIRHEYGHVKGYGHHKNSRKAVGAYKYDNSVPVKTGKLSMNWKTPEGKKYEPTPGPGNNGKSNRPSHKRRWYSWRNWRAMVSIAKLLVSLVEACRNFGKRRKASNQKRIGKKSNSFRAIAERYFVDESGNWDTFDRLPEHQR